VNATGTNTVDQAVSSARHAMLTWQGDGCARLESVRVLWPAENRLRCSGRLIVTGAGDEEAHSAAYELGLDEAGALRRLVINSTCGEYERQVSISRSREGMWLVDDGAGVQRGQFDGALDVVATGIALTTALPLRRLGLHRASGEHTVPVVVVSLPDLGTRLVQQTYRTVRALDDSGTAVVGWDSGLPGADPVDLVVDADGVVLQQPGLATRV
jgi:uncharacterized protein